MLYFQTVTPAVNRLSVRLCIRKRRITNAIEEINFFCATSYLVQNDLSTKIIKIKLAIKEII